jgi:hypothetical protein
MPVGQGTAAIRHALPFQTSVNALKLLALLPAGARYPVTAQFEEVAHDRADSSGKFLLPPTATGFITVSFVPFGHRAPGVQSRPRPFGMMSLVLPGVDVVELV